MTKAILIFSLLVPIGAVSSPIEVKLSFVEALSHKDTTSSKRFRKEYEETIEKGISLANKRAKKCNYRLSSTSSFFEFSDPLQAFETGKRESNAGTWLIVSPRRSNHYLLLVKGTGQTPTLSIMASAKEVFDLPPTNLTMSPSNHSLGKSCSSRGQKEILKKYLRYYS